MAFRSFEGAQISMDDKALNMTDREQKYLGKSWAEVFDKEIFPNIDERPFAVLYSDKASRPNTPVNVIIGALILKELFDLSDDDLVEEIIFDARYQVALHTTSFKEQPVSDKTFTRFRKRCLEYQSETGTDLMHDCMVSLSSSIAKMMRVTGLTRRMDSMMIDSNIKKLSRSELVYSCIVRFVSHICKVDGNAVPDGMSHYLDSDDYNKIFYHQKPSELEDSVASLFKDAAVLLELSEDPQFAGGDCDIFCRCIREQTIEEDGKRRFIKKEDGHISSDSLQSPTDPDATYRTKAGKEHKGYVANFEESVGENGSVITDYRFEAGNYSDSQFMKDSLKAGNTPRDIAADFEFSEDGTKVLRCPAGHVPGNCHFSNMNEVCVLSYPRDICDGCPHKNECRAKIYKRKAGVIVSKREHGHGEAAERDEKRGVLQERFEVKERS